MALMTMRKDRQNADIQRNRGQQPRQALADIGRDAGDEQNKTRPD